MIEARFRIAGFDEVWPLLAELFWMSAQRGKALAKRLSSAELDRLVRNFDVNFEGEC